MTGPELRRAHCGFSGEKRAVEGGLKTGKPFSLWIALVPHRVDHEVG